MKLSNSIKAKFQELLHEVAIKLGPLGFVQEGLSFRKIVDENVAIVDFQRSDASSRDVLKFTVNLAVVCGSLLDADDRDLRGVDAMDGHLRQRLGVLLVDRKDKWWELGASTDVAHLAMEISGELVAKAVPYLDSHLRSDAMISLWESGKSPGLTAVQRARFLSQLKESRKGP